ncbi:hydroxylysine kinase-like [Mytilus trossulus]|uniref:hydroxylysine kinase-like n=1 Tax=Mytilus trossulus TaxID=6551 RepID=UPI0030053320
MSSTVLTPGNIVPPDIDQQKVTQLVWSLYGLHVLDMTELNSYDDRNFHVQVTRESVNPNIKSVSSDGYVLKILNSLDSEFGEAIEAQNVLIHLLANKGINTPKPLKSLDGRLMSTETLAGGRHHIVRLFEYLPGRILAGLSCTKDIAFEVGQLTGELDQCCCDFHHAGFDNHKRIWSLTEVPKLLEFLSYIEDTELKNLAGEVIDVFVKNVVQNYSSLKKGIIHGDVNEQNILVQQNYNCNYHVTGILDFGDAAYSYYIFEVAIAMVYIMLESDILDPIIAGGYTLAGFLAKFPIPESNLNVLKECICARLVQSLIMGLYSTAMHPENSEYVLKTSKKGWNMLKLVWNKSATELKETWNKCF